MCTTIQHITARVDILLLLRGVYENFDFLCQWCTSCSVGGSASLCGVWEEGKEKQKVRKVEEERLKGVRDAREEGKKSAQEAAAALEAAWRLCPGVCSCMVVPCPRMEKFELCEFFPEPVPKRGKCKVRVCVAARKEDDAPLMRMTCF